jgi:predicted metal-dependent hydrolase
VSLARGVELFNRGLYWEAHEAWEEAWTPDRHGPERGFYKGLIQVAAGCLHYTRRNRRGALNKWRSGARLLGPYVPNHRGLAVAELVRAVELLASRLEERPADGDWPQLVLPSLQPPAPG